MKKLSKNIVVVGGLLVGILGAGVLPAHAAGSPAWSYTGISASPPFAHGYSLGWEFSTTQTLYITHLGWWDIHGDGLGLSHDVGIYNLSGTLLVSATVAAGTGELLLAPGGVDTFRYHDLPSDYQLAAGTYRIAGHSGATPSIDGWHQLATGVTTPANVILSGPPGPGYYEASASLVYPTTVAGAPPYSGPNFLFDIPEPSAIAMMSVAGLLLLRRRRG